jgi:hypothetical protein
MTTNRKFSDTLHDSRHLLGALVLLLALSNVPYGNYMLYPFKLFATWIHELCHGMAAIAIGGNFRSLQIFSDTSGLASNCYFQSTFNKVVVASAGYIGTALFGALFLILQRPSKFSRVVAIAATLFFGLMIYVSVRPWGIVLYVFFMLAIVALGFFSKPQEVGRIGLFALGGIILLSLLFATGLFTFIALSGLALLFFLIGLKTPPAFSRFTFSFISAAAGLDAIMSMRVLFADKFVVNGQPVSASDAHVVASALFGPHKLWASLWLAFSVVVLGWAILRTISAEPISPKQLPISRLDRVPDLSDRL